jgi:hypothetical protein
VAGQEVGSVARARLTHDIYNNNKNFKISKIILLLLIILLVRRWLVAAVAAAGDGQNILPMDNVITYKYRPLKGLRLGHRAFVSQKTQQHTIRLYNGYIRNLYMGNPRKGSLFWKKTPLNNILYIKDLYFPNK